MDQIGSVETICMLRWHGHYSRLQQVKESTSHAAGELGPLGTK